jgi:hypothetical protein
MKKWLMVSLCLVSFIYPASGIAAEELEGECYRFIYDPDVFSWRDVEAYASEAEDRCLALQEALSAGPKEPIPVYVKEGRGISTTLTHKNRAIDLFYMRPIDGVEAPLIHETTHILVDSRHPVLREGLAVIMEERLGSLKAHPTYGFKIADWIGGIRCAQRFVKMAEWDKRDWRGGPWESNIIAYAQSASFVLFLMERDGLDSIKKAMQWTRNVRKTSLDRICEQRFGESLAALEKMWLGSLDDERLSDEAEGICEALKGGNIQSYLQERLNN